MSRSGLWVAGVYVVVSGAVAVWEFQQVPAGGWISLPSLRNIGTTLVTLPVLAPLAMVGLKPNLENPWICGLMILLTAGLIYGVVRAFTWRGASV
jgi:hypothetical protein